MRAMAYTTETDVLYRNMDRSSPDRFLLVDGRGVFGSDVVTCYVHIPEQEKVQGNVFVAVGRTVRYRIDVLQSTRRFVPVGRPFVIRRDDGHEISYG